MSSGAASGLVAIDLGLRSGIAHFCPRGRLVAYRSTRFTNRSALRRAASGVVTEHGVPSHVVVEGDAALAAIWAKAATRVGAELHQVTPEVWRATLLHPSERRTFEAKVVADRLARAVIAWSGAKRPITLRDDAAEAICIGIWGCVEVGWLDQLPAEVRPQNRGR